MKIVIISATDKEVLLLKKKFGPHYLQKEKQVSFAETGVGILASCYSISRLLFEQKPDLVIQAGIAGTFDDAINLGDVVVVREEILGDQGVEEDGAFKDVFELNLLEENLFPFINKRLTNPEIEKLNILGLKAVIGITVNEITTRLNRVKEYRHKFAPTIESMEGASLHYCCLQTATPFIQFRSISNYIGERDESKWNFTDALKNLASTVTLYLEQIDKLN